MPEAADTSAPAGGRGVTQRWEPERKTFIVTARTPVVVAPRLLNYPAWRVAVNDVAVRPDTSDAGQMLLALPAGVSRVEMVFTRTPDRLWGIILSFAAALLVALAILLEQRRRGTAI